MDAHVLTIAIGVFGLVAIFAIFLIVVPRD